MHQSDWILCLATADCIGMPRMITDFPRWSMPITFKTGQIVMPEAVCMLYDVKSPRCSSSALWQGDKKYERALKLAMRNLTIITRE